ncbi:MAG TPA: hypothetical protein VIF43_03055 [Patescibacteria group bacterium]|jgi:hypothetical protein
MAATQKIRLIRNLEGGDLFELFLVSAASTILVVRAYLKLADYPQIGGDTLHIAHMLPGGMLMVLGLILALGFLNKEARTLAAFLSGIGFGLFIDELGKFITQDNDYFFQPTIGLIYVIFVMLFLLAKYIGDRRATERENLINAIEAAKEVAIGDLDRVEQRRALAYLKQAGDGAIGKRIAELLREAKTNSRNDENPYQRIRGWLAERYVGLVERPWFSRAVIAFFVLGSSASLVLSAYDIVARPAQVSFADKGELLFSSVTGILVLLGTFRLLRRSRLAGYQTFERAVLVFLFLTQFFLFIQDELAALPGLAIGLLVLSALHYAIRQERYGRKVTRAAGSPG